MSGALPAFTGAGDLIKAGTGTMRLNICGGDRVLGGDVYVNGGILELAVDRMIPRSYVVADGATLLLKDTAFWSSPTKLNGTGLNDQGALHAASTGSFTAPVEFQTDSDINVDASRTLTLRGALSGPGGFAKIGLGTLIINGQANHEGETIVHEGTMQVNATFASSHVTVRAGATLSGAPVFFPMGVTVEEGGTWDRGPNFWWGGGDSNNDGNWSDGTMWVHDEPPAEDEVATFPIVTGAGNEPSGVRTVTIDVPVTVAGVKMPQTGGYVNRILLAADMTIGGVSEYQNWVGGSRIEVPEGTTLRLGNGNVDSKTPSLYGSGTVRKIGTGRLEHDIVGGTPGFSGQLIVEEGTFYMSRGFQLPCTVEVIAGATLHLRPEYGYDVPTTIAGQGYEGQGAIRLSNYSVTISKPLTISADAAINVDGGYVLTQTGAVSGSGGLVKGGPGKLVLTQGSVGGDVTVKTGMLALESGSTIDDSKAVYLETGASIDVAAGQNEAVIALYFNGEPQARGTWGPTGSGAAHINDLFFAGRGGILTVGPAVAVVTQFAVTDVSTGSALFTNERTVTIALAAEPAEGSTIDGWLITESDVEPEGGWLTEVPATYDIAGSEGAITLYAWLLDSNGGIGKASATIQFSTAAPVVADVLVTAGEPGSGTATVTWTTDIPAEGTVKFGPVALSGATPNVVPEGALGTAHSVAVTGIADGVNCKFVLVNNEIAEAPFYWPSKWPIPGDANMDCRVNILDLIFIRNKLNQSVETGDNWKADVNEDTRINILDLIFVRNQLNTQCP